MLLKFKRINVLLVEDEPEIRQSLKEVLEFFFSKVFVASHGLEALHVMQTEPVQMLFTDYEMPHLSGYELVKEIRQLNTRLPITIISNHDDREKLQACMPLGLSGYLFKPLEYGGFKNYLIELEQRLEHEGFFQHRFSVSHVLDMTDHTLVVDGVKHQLTRLECSFLQKMISHKGEVLSKAALEEMLFEFELSDSGIKNIIYRLKKKYGFTYIKNVKEIGYVLLDDA